MGSAAIQSPLLVALKGDVEVCLPPTLATMTTYVALEQEDWFEDEIAFVRRLLKPGMHTIDIGANYGLYTLAMARAVGPSGHVWAFEPASATATYLRESLARNRFTNVTLAQCALSKAPGRGCLTADCGAELNRLTSSGGEDIEIDTLDRVAPSFGGAIIDFIKMDAEGAETDIIAGADQFFRNQSPLIMFERYDGKSVNTDIIAALERLGFGFYRLAPGLGALVPAEAAMLDPFQINLFGCRPERAAQLAAEGLLVRAVVAVAPEVGAWTAHVAKRPQLARVSRPIDPNDHVARLFLDALNLYAMAARPGDVTMRWSALRQSLAMLTGLVNQAPTLMRLFALARVAAEAGTHAMALGALGQLPLDPAAYRREQIDAPLLPANPRFDTLDDEGQFGLWCAVSVFEQLDRMRGHSSFFTQDDSLPYFEAFRKTAFFSPEMERRRQLVRIRTGRQPGPSAETILATRSDGNLNVAFWQTGAMPVSLTAI